MSAKALKNKKGEKMDKEERNEEVKNEVQFPVIGMKAPEFTAVTTEGMVHFPNDYKGKWVILFSHPSDFTPVCTTEFMTFASMQDEFKELNTEIIGLSVDSLHSHLAWKNSISNLEFNGIEKPEIKFPIIEDIKMEVSRKYGMIQGESDNSAVRAVFFINPEGIVKTILYYPSSLGRNFKEIKRIILGLQKAEKDNVAIPADWEPGKPHILPPPRTREEIEERMKLKGKENVDVKDWYLTFKKD